MSALALAMASCGVLRGEDGEQGDRGPAGPQGPPGADGPAGAGAAPAYRWVDVSHNYVSEGPELARFDEDGTMFRVDPRSGFTTAPVVRADHFTSTDCRGVALVPTSAMPGPAQAAIIGNEVRVEPSSTIRYDWCADSFINEDGDCELTSLDEPCEFIRVDNLLRRGPFVPMFVGDPPLRPVPPTPATQR